MIERVQANRERRKRQRRVEDRFPDSQYLRFPPGRPFTRLEKVLTAMVTMFLIAVIAAVVVAGVAVSTANDLKSEAAERINSTCRLFESESLARIQGVRATYQFLEELSPNEYGTSLTTALITRLPEQYKTAQQKSPFYCDKPGVGLPEPTARSCARSSTTCESLPKLPPCPTPLPSRRTAQPCKDFSALLKRPNKG